MMAPQTGEFGRGVGFRGLVWGWSRTQSLFRVFCIRQNYPKGQVTLGWIGIWGWKVGTCQVGCIGEVD